MSPWLTVAAAGAGTFAIRLSWLAFAHRGEIPGAARTALRFVMPTVLAAIIAPAVLYADDGKLDLSFAGNERILAAIAAALIAWATRSMWLTITTGMALLWALKAIT
jgi:branched-subunit amino acid transport protein